MSITIKTQLHSGISESSGGGETRTHYEYNTGPRNLLIAIEQLVEHRSDMVFSYGNVGCGGSWLEIDGQPVCLDDLEEVFRDDAKFYPRGFFDYIKMKTRTTKAKELIAEVQRGDKARL